MPPTKIKSPTLIGGISQQPPHRRFPSQVDQAVNVVFDVATGASKRPGTEFVTAPSTLSVDGDYSIESLEIGTSEYIIVVGNGGSGASIFRVFQADGREATVNIDSASQTYIDLNSPNGSDFRFASNAELTVVLNTTVTADQDGSGSLDPASLPHKLTRTSAESATAVAVFALDPNTWPDRTAGTDSNNPGPTVAVDHTALSDVTFYRDRLVLAGGEYIAFSEVGEYFNFWLVDPTSIVDSDTLEARVASNIQSIQDFKRALVIFTESGQQYESNTPDLLTPTTLGINPTTFYETQDVHPVALGAAIFFIGDKTGTSILFEYLYDDTQISSVAAETTRHVDDLLPDTIRSLDGSSGNTTVLMLPNNQPEGGDLLLESGDLLLLESGGSDNILLDVAPTGSNELYVYRYYYNAESKQQSAFSIYRYGENDTIADIAVMGNYCYMLTKLEGGSTAYVLERQPLGLSAGPAEGLDCSVHLDRQVLLTGAYSSPNTTWTLDSSALSANKAVLGGGFGETAGTELDLTQDGAAFSVAGEYNAGSAFVGQTFTFTLQPTRLFRRDRNGVADILGDLWLSKIGIEHYESCEYDLVVSTPRRADRTKSFSATAPATGKTEAFFGGEADDTTVKIQSVSSKQVTISAYEVDANHHPRA